MSENKDQSYKVILLGSSGVGKTCIISQYIWDTFDENSASTNGSSYSSKEVKLDDNKKILLDIWDTAGQEKYKSLTRYFYKDSKVALLIYDITNKESFKELKEFWVNEIKNFSSENVILGLVGNKYDLFLDADVTEDEGKELAGNIGAFFKLVSAKTNMGIDDLFLEIAQKCDKNSHKFKRRKTILLNENKDVLSTKSEKKKCCK